jgi:hypothetical protein
MKMHDFSRKAASDGLYSICQSSIDIQDQSSYTPTMEKEVHVNSKMYNLSIPFCINEANVISHRNL